MFYYNVAKLLEIMALSGRALQFGLYERLFPTPRFSQHGFFYSFEYNSSTRLVIKNKVPGNLRNDVWFIIHIHHDDF